MIDNTLRSLFEITVTSSLLIAALLLFRRIFRRRISPRLQYTVWALVVIRLLMPVSLPSPASIMNTFQFLPGYSEQPVVQLQTAPEQYEKVPVATGSLIKPGTTGTKKSPAAANTGTAPDPVEAAAINISAVILLSWLAGMTAVVSYMTVLNVRFIHKVRSQASRLPDVQCELPVYRMDGLPSPCLTGILHPKIIVTAKALQSPKMLAHVLTHEICHFRQRDHWIALLRNLCCIIYWYNPLVWLAASVSKADCELSCDSRVLDRLGEEEHISYGETLLALIRQKSIPAGILHSSTAMAAEKNTMKERIYMIAGRHKTLKVTIVSAILVLVAVSVLTMTSALKDTEKKTMETSNDLSYNQIDMGSSGTAATARTGSDTVNPQTAALTTAMPSTISQKATASFIRITIPKTITDPEKSFVDFFKSIGYDSRLVVKDNNVKRGNETGLSLQFDLGNGTIFYATVFKLGNKEDNAWEVLDSSFGNPDKELLSALIETKLDEIIAGQNSDETDHNKEAFKSNTLDEIVKYGEPAYDYMAGQFASRNGKGARGDLMAEACIEIIGYRNNVPAGWKTGEEWYSQLKPLEMAALPSVKPPEGNTLEELATAAALEHYKPVNKEGIVLVAPYIYDKYEENGILTIWVTVRYQEYTLFGKKLAESGGGSGPAAIKLRRSSDGTYSLAGYIEAMDGSGFGPSVRKFCKLKKGVAEKILNHSGNLELNTVLRENLLNYLKENNLTGIYLEEYNGKQTPLT